MKDGIRALLFDTYYGAPVGGRVKTDIAPTAAKRAQLERQIGTAAVDAALRIRDRISGRPTGPRGVYLCHALCEWARCRCGTALGQIRDYLERDPDELLVLVVEDSVEAERLRQRGPRRRASSARPTRAPYRRLADAASMIADDRRLACSPRSRGRARRGCIRRSSRCRRPLQVPAGRAAHRPGSAPGLCRQTAASWCVAVPGQPLDRHLARAQAEQRGLVNAHGPLLRRARVVSSSAGCAEHPGRRLLPARRRLRRSSTS